MFEYMDGIVDAVEEIAQAAVDVAVFVTICLRGHSHNRFECGRKLALVFISRYASNLPNAQSRL